MLKRGLFLILLIVLLLAACAPRAAAPMFDTADSYRGVPESAPAEQPAMEMEGRAGEVTSDYDTGVNAVDRLVIRNADLSIVVKSPADSLQEVMRMANQMGGFVVDSNLYQRQTATGIQVQEARVTVRVPAAQLDDAMTRIKALVENPATDILNENVTGQDVTKEYTDLQSRLRNLEDAAEQLRKIMDSATRSEDVLAVFNELRNVTEQIELIKGQIKYYEESAAMSAISVYIQAQESIGPLTIGTWKPEGVVREALQALISAYQSIATAIMWGALYCLPILIPVGVVVYFIVRGVQKILRNRKAAKVTKVEEPKSE